MIVRKDLEDYKNKRLQEIKNLEEKRDQELAETMDRFNRQIDTVKGKISVVDELITEHTDELQESPGELV